MNDQKTRIWLSPPHISPRERDLVSETFDSNWIAPLGPQVDAFERELAAYLDVPEVVALSSGTAALHLALLLLGVGPNDTVLCQSFTFAASANPIVYLGAKPVFLDSEAETWNLSPELLQESLEDLKRRGIRPKALICVDLYGVPARFDRIVEICERFDVALIEDAAEALGGSYDGRKLGGFGTLGVLSFNGNKIITTSGGGALVCHSVEHATRTRFLATQARDPAPHYQHSQIGYNYRMSNVLAAIGRGQLSVLDERVVARRKIFDYYRTRLGKVAGITFPTEPASAHANRWLTTILVDPARLGGVTRDTLIAALAEDNIESRPLWKPLHVQPVFAETARYGGALCEKLFAQGLCLPSGSALSESDLNRICAIIEATPPANLS